MIKSKFVLYCLIFLFSAFSSNVFAQSIDEIRFKTAFIPHIIDNVVWKGKKSSVLNINYLGFNDDYEKALLELKKSGSVKKYTIEIHKVNSVSQLKKLETDILWIDKQFNESLSSISKKLEGAQLLILTSGCDNKKDLMINFDVLNEKVHIEINKVNLYAKNISVSSDLLIYGGTEVDVAKIYKKAKEDLIKAENSLNSQKEKARQYKSEAKQNETLLKDQQNTIKLQKSNLIEKLNELSTAQKTLLISQKKLKTSSLELTAKLNQIETSKRVLIVQSDELQKKEEQASLLDAKIIKKDFEIANQKTNLLKKESFIKRQNLFLFIAVGLISLFIILLYIIFKQNNLKKKANRDLILVNETIQKQKGKIEESAQELLSNKNLIENKNAKLEQANEMINSGIRYATRIQQGIIPTAKDIQNHLPSSFVFFEPMEQLSGDFYFIEEVENKLIFGVVDCTGHGISGALLSVLGYNIIQELIAKKVTSPAELLTELDNGVYKVLNQRGQNIHDGMDISVTVIDKSTNSLVFSGANLPIYLKNKTANEEGKMFSTFQGTRTSIGGFNMGEKVFEETVINLDSYSHFYLFSDGYKDQLGGEKGKRIGRKRFYDLVAETSKKPIDKQIDVFASFLSKWQPEKDRNDDVTLIGVEL